MNYGKVALITGAASGIGHALATILASEGYSLVLCDNHEQRLAKTVADLNVTASVKVVSLCGDMRLPETSIALTALCFESFGKVDLVFNNAGIIGELAPLWAASQKTIQDIFDVNVFGVLSLIQALIPVLIEKKQTSHIINMGSVYSIISGSHVGLYSMTKHAILALSESLYFDLKRENHPIEVSLVMPSFVNTSLVSKEENNTPVNALMNRLLVRGREPIDVAQQIVAGVLNKQFYIMPDREVKDYAEHHLSGIIEQNDPHQHSLEKIFSILLQRSIRYDNQSDKFDTKKDVFDMALENVND